MFLCTFGLGFVGNESRSFRDVHSIQVSDTIALSILDYLFMGRMFPGAKSIVAMIGITVGAIWYVSGDVKSEDVAYVYCAIFCLKWRASKEGLQKIPLIDIK